MHLLLSFPTLTHGTVSLFRWDTGNGTVIGVDTLVVVVGADGLAVVIGADGLAVVVGADGLAVVVVVFCVFNIPSFTSSF
jgi:hypothetical protein